MKKKITFSSHYYTIFSVASRKKNNMAIDGQANKRRIRPNVSNENAKVQNTQNQ